jgi:hypothetical protein
MINTHLIGFTFDGYEFIAQFDDSTNTYIGRRKFGLCQSALELRISNMEKFQPDADLSTERFALSELKLRNKNPSLFLQDDKLYNEDDYNIVDYYRNNHVEV